nr:helix-turn-helix domain-containing protein [Pontibacter sp. BT310]
MFNSGAKIMEEIAKILHISRATCYRYLSHTSFDDSDA